MNTAIITLKTDPQVKKQAQALAEELGLSLSAVINGLLKKFVRTQSISLSLNDQAESKLTEWTIKQLATSKQQQKNGEVSSKFHSVKDAINWLES